MSKFLIFMKVLFFRIKGFGNGDGVDEVGRNSWI